MRDKKNYETNKSKYYWKLFTKLKSREREPVTFKKLSKTIDFDYNKKYFQKVVFIGAQNLRIFDIMGRIKFLSGKKAIQLPGKTNRLSEAILFDRTSDISITIRGELTQPIEEGRK